MNAKNGSEKAKYPAFLSRLSDRVIFGLLGALTLVTALVAGLNRWANLYLINSALYIVLPAIILFGAVAWGVYALVRRIRRKTLKLVVGSAAGMAMFMLFIVLVLYGSVFINITMPQKFASVKSDNPGAARLVVMRMLDGDQERIEARRSARLAADPEGDPEITVDDWGFVYTAYRQVGPFFYRQDTPREGEVWIGYKSPSQLMVDWQDDGMTARFFADNPGPGDGGEMTVSAAR